MSEYKEYHKLYEYQGECPICDREMFDDGSSINKHHFVPKSRGGKEKSYTHRVCQDMLHKIWTEKELEQEYFDPVVIREDPRVQDFVKWVSKKDPLFYIKSRETKEKKKKRRR